MAKRKVQKPQNPKKAQPKKNGIYVWATVLLLMVAFGWYVVHVWRQQQAEVKAGEAIYDAFGIDMPTNYYIHGIDVSSFQNTIAWQRVATMRVKNVSMGFAFIKSTEGLMNVDDNYRRNYLNARKAGMICGSYHFFLATKSGAAQAANFIKNTNVSTGDLPPVVDIEHLYGVPAAIMRKRLKEYLTVIEATYKTKPIIYSYVDFYEKNLGNEFNDYPLWVAHYDEQDKPRIGRDWTFWQHSEDGHVNGIAGKVDCDVFNGDSTAFRQMLLQK